MLLLTNLQPTKKLYFRKSTFAQCLDNALYEEIMKYLTSRICRAQFASCPDNGNTCCKNTSTFTFNLGRHHSEEQGSTWCSMCAGICVNCVLWVPLLPSYCRIHLEKCQEVLVSLLSTRLPGTILYVVEVPATIVLSFVREWFSAIHK